MNDLTLDTLDSLPTTPANIVSRMSWEISATASVQSFARAHPELFFVAYCTNCMALKDLPKWRVSLSVCGTTLVLHDTSTILKGGTANIDMGDIGLPTNDLARLGKEVLDDLQTQLDHECRRNQAIFHTNAFIMDSIFEIFKNHNLSAKETYYLRSQCMKWHQDYQHRFLFRDLYDWCRDFGDEHPEC
jgi:hypothetical protein